MGLRGRGGALTVMILWLARMSLVRITSGSGVNDPPL
jgi:hypothetical protein